VIEAYGKPRSTVAFVLAGVNIRIGSLRGMTIESTGLQSVWRLSTHGRYVDCRVAVKDRSGKTDCCKSIAHRCSRWTICELRLDEIVNSRRQREPWEYDSIAKLQRSAENLWDSICWELKP